jgi:hypothetical protein
MLQLLGRIMDVLSEDTCAKEQLTAILYASLPVVHCSPLRYTALSDPMSFVCVGRMQRVTWSRHIRDRWTATKRQTILLLILAI